MQTQQVTSSCIFSGQPYHCAVTRFEKDYMVPLYPSCNCYYTPNPEMGDSTVHLVSLVVVVSERQEENHFGLN